MNARERQGPPAGQPGGPEITTTTDILAQPEDRGGAQRPQRQAARRPARTSVTSLGGEPSGSLLDGWDERRARLFSAWCPLGGIHRPMRGRCGRCSQPLVRGVV